MKERVMRKEVGTVAVGALLLVGCGGGGSGAAATRESPTITATNTPTPSPTRTTPTPTRTATPTPTATMPGPVTLVCGEVGGGQRFEARTVLLDEDGVPDYSILWPQELRCDTGMAASPPAKFARVQTPMQEAVVAAAKEAGYSGQDSEILYSVYQYCGSNVPDDSYVTMEDFSASQVAELQAWMVLCPNHPQAEAWREGIERSGEVIAAKESGAIVYGGTHSVPEEMQRGRFTATDVTDCYWETRDSDGRIIDNDFVLAAPRVVAQVGDNAVVFTSQGCGRWTKE